VLLPRLISHAITSSFSLPYSTTYSTHHRHLSFPPHCYSRSVHVSCMVYFVSSSAIREFMFKKKNIRHTGEIYPDEVMLDSRNLPAFDKTQFEGEIESPIAKRVPWVLGVCCMLALLLVLGRFAQLQVVEGKTLYERSVKNTLRYVPEYAPRGTVTDRHGINLAWNEARRTYIAQAGFGHVLGYVGYPKEDEIARAAYEPKELIGIDGIEAAYNQKLQGQKGKKLVEVDAHGAVVSEAVHVQPEPGAELRLSIDSRLQHLMYESLKSVADERGFTGGAGLLMDVQTGELLTLTNYPEYESNELSPGNTDRTKLASYFSDKRQLFLNRAVDGLYTPGSVVKPILALAALAEGIISPDKEILSTGELRLKNPYNPGQDSVFKDWKAHGFTDMRRAIAVSSDVYFYEIGGGYGSQRGLGIANIEKYSRLFGLAEKTGVILTGEPTGTIPSPSWKEANFDGEPWRVGDTYHTAIGQYGYQVTPLQMLRATAAIANKGKLLVPQLVYASSSMVMVEREIPLAPEKFAVVHEGMQLAVEAGTAIALNVPYVHIAGKTGTAELGATKAYVNSWVTGFFPFAAPRYAFVVVMEKGKRANTVGASAVMRRFLDKTHEMAPEYFE